MLQRLTSLMTKKNKSWRPWSSSNGLLPCTYRGWTLWRFFFSKSVEDVLFPAERGRKWKTTLQSVSSLGAQSFIQADCVQFYSVLLSNRCSNWVKGLANVPGPRADFSRHRSAESSRLSQNAVHSASGAQNRPPLTNEFQVPAAVVILDTRSESTVGGHTYSH